MTITATGPGSAWLAPQQRQDGTWVLAVTALPTAADVPLTLAEAQAGYDNTPHQTAYVLTYALLSAAPILRPNMKPIGDRTFLFKRIPDRAALPGLPTSYAAVCKQPFDPKDQAPYWPSWAQFFADDQGLGRIVSVAPAAAAVALGISIDTGPRRPAIDLVQDLIELRFRCSDPTNAAFAGEGTYVGIRVTVETDGDLPSTYTKTLALLVRTG